MKEFLSRLQVAILETNEKGQLKQNVRNQFKADFQIALLDFFVENGIDAVMTEDGIAVEVGNENLGSIPVVVGATVKNFEFDVMTAHQNFVDKGAERIAKAIALEEIKQKKIAEANALKQKKATTK